MSQNFVQETNTLENTYTRKFIQTFIVHSFDGREKNIIHWKIVRVDGADLFMCWKLSSCWICEMHRPQDVMCIPHQAPVQCPKVLHWCIANIETYTSSIDVWSCEMFYNFFCSCWESEKSQKRQKYTCYSKHLGCKMQSSCLSKYLMFVYILHFLLSARSLFGFTNVSIAHSQLYICHI